MIMAFNHRGSILFFVSDDMGYPVSFAYPTRQEAETVEELIRVSDGEAKIPDGVDVEKSIRESNQESFWGPLVDE